MKSLLIARFILTTLILISFFSCSHREGKEKREQLDVNAIIEAAGTEATRKKGVVRIGWSRDDVPVMVDGMKLDPAAGLGSWAAFKKMGDEAMVMGDTVVFQDEVSPAMDAAFAHGLEVTALHNHFLFDEPKVYFMHIVGKGAPMELSAAVKGVWDAIKEVRAKRSQPAKKFQGKAPKTKGNIDAKTIEKIIGRKSSAKGGVVKVSIGRKAKMDGMEFDGAMGLTTWAAFSGTDEYAVVDGDFAMTKDEVQPVLKTLRSHGIHIVALHNHMIGEEPAYYFTHYWGKGPAKELARAIKEALEAQNNI